MNGILKLWLNKIRPLEGPHTFTTYRPWNARWPELAEFIWMTRRNGHPIRVGIYAYSYGAGWGAVRLAKELGQRGLAVDAMVLADPVFRPPLRLLGWLSLLRVPRIRLPANVRDVTWFYQTTNRPSGHQLVDARNQLIAGRHVPDVIHQYMDDLPEFHACCLETARGLT